MFPDDLRQLEQHRVGPQQMLVESITKGIGEQLPWGPLADRTPQTGVGQGVAPGVLPAQLGMEVS